MSRHAFWTIIVGGSPTAFRAPLPEDLQPTLVQLQRTHPDAVIRWFEKGQLWETPGHAQDAFAARQDAARPRRGPTWRPGGDHKDPRDKYKQPRDVKRKKWAAQAADGRGPWVKKEGRAEGAKEGRNEGRREGPPRDARAPRPAWSKPGDRPPQDRRPAGGDRRPASAGGDRRPSGGGARSPGAAGRPPRRDGSASPPRRDGSSSRPSAATRPPRPPETTSGGPPAASAKRKPRVFKAGELPPKRKKRDDE